MISMITHDKWLMHKINDRYDKYDKINMMNDIVNDKFND